MRDRLTMRWDGHESAYRVTGDRLFEPPTPTGFRHLAQDCPRSGLPWVRESWTSQPPRGCVLSRGNPLGSIGDVRRNPVGQRREGFLRDHAHQAASTLPAPSPPRATWLSVSACCGGEGGGEGATSLATAPSPRPSPPQWSLFRKPYRMWGRGGRTLGNALWISFTAWPSRESQTSTAC